MKVIYLTPRFILYWRYIRNHAADFFFYSLTFAFAVVASLCIGFCAYLKLKEWIG